MIMSWFISVWKHCFKAFITENDSANAKLNWWVFKGLYISLITISWLLGKCCNRRTYGIVPLYLVSASILSVGRIRKSMWAWMMVALQHFWGQVKHEEESITWRGQAHNESDSTRVCWSSHFTSTFFFHFAPPAELAVAAIHRDK